MSTDQTKWLTPDEQRAWRAYLTMSTLLHATLERELNASEKLSHAYYEILVHLSESSTRSLRMGQLASRTNSSRSRLSHAVSRLEVLGLVTRCPADDDLRGFTATLTDEGFRVLEKAAPSHVTSVREHLLEPLTEEELATLGRISEKVTAHLRTVQPSGTTGA